MRSTVPVWLLSSALTSHKSLGFGTTQQDCGPTGLPHRGQRSPARQESPMNKRWLLVAAAMLIVVGISGVVSLMTGESDEPVSYTHLTLPTTPYV